ncbi:hypothetical protein PMZ80_002809 [Knufia obscura]|uniref:DUF6590 domain-containing protein n=1 Tax=Knufia obscura TaxID=1635080 RepID=A0ABR0RZB8_9EURO|nr:hypothetical protein PMZ80_002809 [Knufia obscura]
MAPPKPRAKPLGSREETLVFRQGQVDEVLASEDASTASEYVPLMALLAFIENASNVPLGTVPEHYVHASRQQTQQARQARPRPSNSATVQEPTLAEILQPIPQLLTYFIGYGEEQFDTCLTFCKKYPSIWDEDFSTLATLVLEYIKRGDEEAARRVAQRYLMLELSSRAKSIEGRIEWLERRNRKGKDRDEFELLCQNYLEKARVKVGKEPHEAPTGASTGPNRHDAKTIKEAKGEGDNAVKKSSGRPGTVTQAPGSQNLPQSAMNTAGLSKGGPARHASQSMNQPPPNIQGGLGAPTATRSSGQGQRRQSMTSDIGSFRGGPAAVGDRPYRPGPNPEYTKSWPKAVTNQLHESYKVYYGKKKDEVFQIGSMLAVFWHENYGSHLPPEMQDVPRGASLDRLGQSGFITQADNQEQIFSNYRRFIIVNMRDGFSVGIPITTYSGKGITAKKLSDRERSAHTIVYDSTLKPTLLPNEPEFPKDPIAVKMKDGKTLKPSSRLYYAKPSSINHNIKVQHLGNVIPSHIHTLLLNFDEEVSPLSRA